ncbi:MAG: flagellin [Bryobacteraceae bacterium]
MAFSIQTNVNSLIAQENLRVTSDFQSRTIQRLTSGFRINQSGDDAAGLAIANKFRSDVAELSQGVRNANDGIAQLQIMDGGMNNIAKMLDRLKTLATQSASDTFTGDRAVLNREFNTLVQEIDRQAQSIKLNTGGAFARSLDVFIGGGAGASSSAILTNGKVTVDLSSAVVDAQTLGMQGMQAANSGTDIGDSNATTSVADIVADSTNAAAISNNRTIFKVFGAGFPEGVSLSVDLTNVNSTSSLVSAVNDAIATAAQNDADFDAADLTASIATDSTGKQSLAFTSSSNAVQVRAGDRMANALLGNFSSGATGAAMTSTVQGQAFTAETYAGTETVRVTIQGGGMASPVTLSISPAAADDAADVAAAIQAAVAADTTLAAAGITVSKADTRLDFTSASGEVLKVSISGDAEGALGYGNFLYSGGTEYTSIVAGGAWAAAADAANALFDLSVDGGASDRLTVDAFTPASADEAVTAINNAIAAKGASSEWKKAGMVAYIDSATGNLALKSGNGTSFRLAVNTADATDLDVGMGFGDPTAVVAVFAGVASAGTAAFNGYVAAGAYQLGSANTAQAMTFTGVNYGDRQGVTISATSADGVVHTTVVTLQHSNARTIDEALDTINDALHNTSDSTLQKITAVKINDSGTQKIEFVSSLSTFSVALGSTASGTGIKNSAGSQGVTVASTKVGTGASLDISTADNAETAVSALAAAVSTLGLAQAAVGKAQNQLSYALGLAQSQISNYSAAESRIRDADVASEAANLTKAQVLQQASMAAMAQANSAPQAVLALLRG